MAEKQEPLKFASSVRELLDVLPRLTPLNRFLVVSLIASMFCFMLFSIVSQGLSVRPERDLKEMFSTKQWRGTWKDISGRDAGKLSLTVHSWLGDDEFLGFVAVRGVCSYHVHGKITVKKSPFAARTDQVVRVALDATRKEPYRMPDEHAPWVLIGKRTDESYPYTGYGLEGRCENANGRIVGTFELEKYMPYLSYNQFLDVGIDVGTCETAIQEKTYWDGVWSVNERGEPTGKLRLSISQRSQQLDYFRGQLSLMHKDAEGWQGFTVPVNGTFSGRRIQFAYGPSRLESFRKRISKMSEIPIRFEGYLQNGVMKGRATHATGSLVSEFYFTPQFSTKHVYRNQGVPQ